MSKNSAHTTMHALVVHQTGWPNAMQVEDRPRPAAGPDSVLIRVHAAGLNFADTLVIGGSYQEKQALPFIPGAELSGEVIQCGSEVRNIAVGDRVMGQVPAGAYAEYAVLHMHRLAVVPQAMPDREAAGFYVPYGTAICALRERGRLKAGETLLILGAAGAVGLAAIQVGKAMGARVIGVSRKPGKRDAVMRAGADAFISHETGDLKAALKASGEGGVDVVLDMVGSEATAQALRCLNFEGRLVIIGFTGGQAALLKSNHILVKNIDIVGCYWGPYQTLRPEATRTAFDMLFGWYAQGLLRPQVADTVDLSGISAALERLTAGQYAGKVVATIAKNPSVHQGDHA